MEKHIQYLRKVGPLICPLTHPWWRNQALGNVPCPLSSGILDLAALFPPRERDPWPLWSLLSSTGTLRYGWAWLGHVHNALRGPHFPSSLLAAYASPELLGGCGLSGGGALCWAPWHGRRAILLAGPELALSVLLCLPALWHWGPMWLPWSLILYFFLLLPQISWHTRATSGF